MRRRFPGCFAAALLFLSSSCAAPHRLPPPHRFVYSDDTPVPRPRSRGSPLIEEIIEKTFILQLEQAFDLPRMARKLAGKPYEALNVDDFDKVPNSTWFTNRNAERAMSLEAIRRGPNRGNGPDTDGPWTVVALKTVGVTPGMVIVDRRGDRYIIKFDPIDYPELPSGAEIVAARLFYAAGYNVPENFIVHLDPVRLSVGLEARRTEETADKRDPLSSTQLDKAELAAVVRRAIPRGQQRVRVLASRILPGTPIGPWAYEGTRSSDPNDLYPHEHRREVRGLYVVASWLNHADMKEENTLDMYDPRREIVTHYLIDFGAALGSNSSGPSDPRRGQANSFDLKDSLFRLFSAGLYVHDYERAPKILDHPAVGYVDNALFEPDAWKPMYPVPAFENLTARDAFWGAHIVTSFSDAQIAAAVSAADFSSPQAEKVLSRFLRERRDRIGRFWFSRLNPLDHFRVDDSALRFVDLAAEHGYTWGPAARYEYTVTNPSGSILAKGSSKKPSIALDPIWGRFGYVVVSVLPLRLERRAEPVLVYVQSERHSQDWKVIGLRRLD